MPWPTSDLSICQYVLVTGCDHRIDILAWCCKAHKTKAASGLIADSACRYLDPMSLCIPAGTLQVLTKQ